MGARTSETTTTQTLPSFSKGLFHGDVLEELIFPYPGLSEEEAENTKMLLESITQFAKTVDWRKHDEEGEFSEGFLKQICELGLLGLIVPEEYGGLGLSSSSYVRLAETVAGIDGSLAVTIGAHSSIGFKALSLFGNEQQKAKYFPALATGEKIACFALTEPGSGSDAGSIKTKAVLSDDKKHYIINGQKLWITNAKFASFMTLFAKTEVPDENGGTKEKITAFIVDLPSEGLTVGPPEHKMGIRSSATSAVFFENVKVPVENVLGIPGEGFKIAMEVLNNGRSGLAGGSIGGAKAMIQMAIEHVNQRKQFGKTLSEFGMIQEKIGRMVVDTFAAESMVYMTTGLIDRGECDYSLESAISKVFATDVVWKVANEALQIYGGMGFMRECRIERVVRDARINLIFEGTNEILRLFIALAGLQGPGQELMEVAKAIKEPLAKIGVLSGFAAKQIRLNVVGTKINKAHPALKREAGLFEDYVAEFALQCSKLLQRHGKSITERQFACRRIADIVIDLYAMACVLSRVSSLIEKNGESSCQHELSLAYSFFTRANRRIRGNFKAIDRNDDDHLKSVAKHQFEKGLYSWDFLNH